MVRQLHHTKAAVAITLALTASLPAIASADPPQLSRAEATIAAADSGARVQPNPDEQASLQSAYAGPCSEVCSGGAESYTSRTALVRRPGRSGARLPHDPRPRSVAVPALHATRSSSPTLVRVVTHPGGFHWADAGIGAAAAIVIVGLALGGARAVTTSRKRHSPQQGAIVAN